MIKLTHKPSGELVEDDPLSIVGTRVKLKDHVARQQMMTVGYVYTVTEDSSTIPASDDKVVVYTANNHARTFNRKDLIVESVGKEV